MWGGPVPLHTAEYINNFPLPPQSLLAFPPKAQLCQQSVNTLACLTFLQHATLRQSSSSPHMPSAILSLKCPVRVCMCLRDSEGCKNVSVCMCARAWMEVRALADAFRRRLFHSACCLVDSKHRSAKLSAGLGLQTTSLLYHLSKR